MIAGRTFGRGGSIAAAKASSPFWQARFETTELSGWGEWSIVQGINAGEGPGATECFVGDAAALGITPRTGTKAAQFRRVSDADSLPHAKAFVEWNMAGSTKDDFWNRPLKVLDRNGDPSGIYTCWCYYPAGATITSSQWTNVVQFKEEGVTGGVTVQNPSWWLNMSRQGAWAFRGLPNTNVPIFFVQHWQYDFNTEPVPNGTNTGLKWMLVPEGRWFEIRVHLYEGDRVEFYVDGTLLWTGLNSVWPVGRMTTTPRTWIYGIGHYEGQGKLYFDDCSFRRFP